MSWSNGERLYNLMPAIYRLADSAEGEPLRALLSVIESELETIEADIAGLHDNWFIETCDPWVIPYIGDLVRSTPLHEATRPLRADVAKTISYRRRKATVPMLSELTRDVTGWDALVVEFFRLLLWNQHVNHLRTRRLPNPLTGTSTIAPVAGSPGSASITHLGRLNPDSFDAVGNVHVRHLDAVDRLDGPFDVLSHTVDVRKAGSQRDRYSIRTLGFFLWRLENYRMEQTAARASADAAARDGGSVFGYHFDQVRAPAPLFHHPVVESDPCASPGEANVSGPIRPLAIHRDLEDVRMKTMTGGTGDAPSAYVGDERSVEIVVDGQKLAPAEVVIMDLKSWKRPPTAVDYATFGADAEGDGLSQAIVVGIDVERGRLAFADGMEPESGEVIVTYEYGFGGDLGGGPYRRGDGLVSDDNVAQISISAVDSRAASTALADVLADWSAPDSDHHDNTIITIEDNATYVLSNEIHLQPGDRLVIQAGDEKRPTILVDGGVLAVSAQADVDDAGSLTLGGLLIEGAVRVTGDLEELSLLHCSLVPGRRLEEADDRDDPGDPVGLPLEPNEPSVDVDAANDRLTLTIDHCIVGPIRMPSNAVALVVTDSIIDAMPTSGGDDHAIAAEGGANPAAGPKTTLERVTVLGPVSVRQLLLASEVIFIGTVRVERRQDGCVRFSYVPLDSITPRRYRCQPELALSREIDHSLTCRRDDLLARTGNGLSREAAEQQVRAAIRTEIMRRITPAFTSRRYGNPAYGQLARSCAEPIRTGAEDGSEMGAFHMLRQPQRKANLRLRLDEYMPFGLEPAVEFVT
jgi:hypothetical protein